MSYSPALAIATAVFEISAAVWVLRGPGRKRVVRTAAAILLLLAGYQAVEVGICSIAPSYGFLPRLAFMVVTWLPPLGILLISFLLGPGAWVARLFAHGMLCVALGVQFWIALDAGFAHLSVCEAVYARYAHPTPGFVAYSAFYWLGLLGLIGFAAYGALRPRDAHDGRLASLMLTGAVAFLVPAVITSSFLPTAEGALPSIMCHFAVLLALFLVCLVHLERREHGVEQQGVLSPALDGRRGGS